MILQVLFAFCRLVTDLKVNSAGVEPTTSWAVTKCSIH
mgnify:CR=1 FL=1